MQDSRTFLRLAFKAEWMRAERVGEGEETRGIGDAGSARWQSWRSARKTRRMRCHRNGWGVTAVRTEVLGRLHLLLREKKTKIGIE